MNVEDDEKHEEKDGVENSSSPGRSRSSSSASSKHDEVDGEERSKGEKELENESEKEDETESGGKQSSREVSISLSGRLKFKRYRGHFIESCIQNINMLDVGTVTSQSYLTSLGNVNDVHS